MNPIAHRGEREGPAKREGEGVRSGDEKMTHSNLRRLRRDQTTAEQRLWTRLRDRQLAGHKFRRQVPLGRFIVDLACYDARLIVEIDGGQHADQQEDDAARAAWLESRGFRVLRFWNHEVLENMEGVLAQIAEVLEDR